jgi:hypothetical protein
MHDIFDEAVTAALVTRVRALTPASQPRWGRMNVAQMLAHCSVAYDMVYDPAAPRPGLIVRWVLRTFVKPKLLEDKPFPKNAPTSGPFKVSPQQDFEVERDRLIAYLERTQAEGGAAFDGRENASFGPLSRAEWSQLFYKHLNHHLKQFGV